MTHYSLHEAKYVTVKKEYDKPVDEGGEPYIEVGAPVETIEALVAKMPHDMFYEIWTAVGEAYPHWGPADPKEISKGSTKS